MLHHDNTYSTERGFSFQLMANGRAVEGFVIESNKNFVCSAFFFFLNPQNSLTVTSH